MVAFDSEALKKELQKNQGSKFLLLTAISNGINAPRLFHLKVYFLKSALLKSLFP